MLSTQQALDAGKLDSLMINTQDDGLLTTNGRFGEDTTKKIFGVESLPVFMKETSTAELYMMQAHRCDDDLAHRLAQDTLARTKSKVWIHQGLQLARRIVKDCPVCKKDKHKLQQQRIGRLPSSMLEPYPPFTNIALDYAGPFLVKGTVNARSGKKVWLILIT